MHRLLRRSPVWPCILAGAACLPAGKLRAQQPIGRISATGVRISGAVDVHPGEMLLGNGSTVTAGGRSVKIALLRGGELLLCATTSIHLTDDRNVSSSGHSALMMALDRGALETSYVVGKYSDVLLTPDLRILISGPGQAQLRIRVNAQGDTCLDNHGADAPYVTVSSQLEGGVYRVLPDQRVTFEHGSLREVVDHETEPCGCPAAPVLAIATAANPSKNSTPPGKPVGGPSSVAADTAFPIAESEGLAPPPAPPPAPVVPAGVAHAEVTVPLTFNGENPPPSLSSAAPPPTTSTSAPPTPSSDERLAAAASARTKSPGSTPFSGTSVNASAAPPGARKGLFHRIGHFFSRLIQW